uniref:Helitron helicase-like domain-containing protein n=1 Tax=Populus trichocarpa TaxID=3694 RepID=A0A2K1YA91_POPTR
MLNFFQCFVFLTRFYTYMTTRRQRLQSSYAINNEQDSPFISSQQENETYICSVGESSHSQPSLYSQNRQDHDCLASTNNQSCSLQSSTLSYADSLGASGSTCVDHELIASAVEQLMIGQLHIKKKKVCFLIILFFSLSMSDNPGYKLRLLGQRTHDSRQYNDPSSDDIGGLIVRDIGDYHLERDIVIESLSGTLQRISKLHPKFMSLQYPFLFPFGEDGYRTNISFANHDNQVPRRRQNVLMRAAYLIHEREYGEDTVTKGGRLYQ